MPVIAESLTSTGVQVSVRPCFSTWRSSMNCASARWRRTTAPERMTKRLPESFAAVSKSMPGFAAGISKCSRGLKSNARGAPHRLISTLAVSSGPTGTSSSGRLGTPISRSWRAASAWAASASSRAISSFFSVTSARRRSNSASSPLALAAPTALLAALRSARASSAALMRARRVSSRPRIVSASGSSPRRDRPSSKACGVSRIVRMSCIAASPGVSRRLCRIAARDQRRISPPGPVGASEPVAFPARPTQRTGR